MDFMMPGSLLQLRASSDVNKVQLKLRQPLHFMIFPDTSTWVAVSNHRTFSWLEPSDLHIPTPWRNTDDIITVAYDLIGLKVSQGNCVQDSDPNPTYLLKTMTSSDEAAELSRELCKEKKKTASVFPKSRNRDPSVFCCCWSRGYCGFCCDISSFVFPWVMFPCLHWLLLLLLQWCCQFDLVTMYIKHWLCLKEIKRHHIFAAGRKILGSNSKYFNTKKYMYLNQTKDRTRKNVH